MSEHLPPTIDPVAASRWQQSAPTHSPWLHEEVARRMQERLQWICRKPQTWCHWQPVRGGLQAHALIAERYAQSPCYAVEFSPRMQAAAQAHWSTPWWSPARWKAAQTRLEMPAPNSVDLLWANMLLHNEANPEQLLKAWHSTLAVDGFVMFSCLGPDTLKELRALYAHMGWPVSGHSFTDMHDWGDMLVHAGFAEPVMDMETITLSFATPERLLQELRELGCNLHPQRFAGLRGRAWLAKLRAAIGEQLKVDAVDGQLTLTFEIVYGHAFKPQPRIAVEAHSAVSLEHMRSMLKKAREQG